ncbi:LysM domain-containing protein [candidate division KSB1 bacterium]|nr:LysM domain-containing protein [candidate division KSB1 bacterium]
MKKIFLTLFFAAGIFVLWSHGEMVWSNRRFLDEPRVHKIEKGEYLSRLAQQYYGDPQRWRELALINRAPNPNHVEVGEKIFVPAANVVAEIGRARTLTKVNALVNDQEKLTREPSQPLTETAPATTPTPSGEATTGNGTAEPVAPVEGTPAPIAIEPVANETSFPWLWIALSAVVFALAGFIIYRWRQNAEPKVNFTVKPKENSFDDFLNRRHYGESGPIKAQPADQKKEDDEETKDKDTGSDDFRSRRKYDESITATN